MADIVAVEQEAVPPQRVQLLFDQIGDGRFAGAGQPGEPQQPRALILLAGMRIAIDIDGLPMDVVRAPEREIDHARADGRVGDPVDQDEAAEIGGFRRKARTESGDRSKG